MTTKTLILGSGVTLRLSLTGLPRPEAPAQAAPPIIRKDRPQATAQSFLNKHRTRTGPYASTDAYGFTGMYQLVHDGYALLILASDGSDAPPTPDGTIWEHVSVSIRGEPNRTPSWRVMCAVKYWFWGNDAWIQQFHPPVDQYVNNHKGCLHLWRPANATFPTPPAWMVGIKEPTPA